jgi:hypothetical protein
MALRRIARRGDARNGLGNLEIQVQVSCDLHSAGPGVGAAATGYTTKNDRNSNLFIHFISILLLPKKANSSRVAVLPSCACTGPLRKSQHFTTAVGRLCIRSAWNGAA